MPYYVDDSKKVDGMDQYREVTLDPLLNSRMLEFEVFHKMNEFVQTGHITYVDDQQMLDPLLGKTVAGFHVTAEQMLSDMDEVVGHTVQFELLVDRIDVIDRKDSSVTYRIHLTDRDVLGLTRNVEFSGHAPTGVRNVGQIILQLFAQTGLSFNKDTLTGINTSLKYVTQANDNVMTAFRYLMRRDFYFRDSRSNSINVVVYNRNRGEYGMYDVRNPEESVKWIEDGLDGSVDNVAYLSMFDHDELERNLQRRQLDIETLSLKGRMQVLDPFKKVDIKTYSVDEGWGGYTLLPS